MAQILQFDLNKKKSGNRERIKLTDSLDFGVLQGRLNTCLRKAGFRSRNFPPSDKEINLFFKNINYKIPGYVADAAPKIQLRDYFDIKYERVLWRA